MKIELLMKGKREKLMEMRFVLLPLALAGAVLCPVAQSQVLIIANPSVTAVDVSKQDLRDVFTGASSSFKGAVQVTPVLLKQGPVNEDFLGLYVGKSDSAFRASWRSLLFSGQGTMPRTLDSDAAVVEYVAHTAGAIGYIGKATPHGGVKILPVR
jgi:ABC-type phosphate transport system substrate-binding protein